MYPKVKVRVQTDEDDQYACEKSSLQSLKAFEWLSLHRFSSSDESSGPVARVPRSYVPMSPPPTFCASEEETHEKKDENQKRFRATSAPRPRAVLSSPDNDGIIGSKTQAKKELQTGPKNPSPCQNRHTRCKIFPKSAAAVSFSPTQAYNKESADPRSRNRAMGRTALAASGMRAGHQKKITPSSAQS